MEKTKDEVLAMFVAAAEKFVKKVETGRAVSKETYADLKACLDAVREIRSE